MIPKKRFHLLFVWLTFLLLVACEPLAPEQTPRYVVVTGETPANAGVPVTSLATPTPTSAVVNTPLPSPTPTPAATPIPSATPFACAQPEGQVIQSVFYSTVAGENVQYRMYQPPCFYDTLQRYPYVVLLHGTGYDEAMWDDLGIAQVLDEGIATGKLPPMMVIMPDGGNLSELNDQPDGTSYEDILLGELLPMLESDFCLWASRDGRAVGGISRGGFWAFSIGLRHPDMFSAIGGHSPYFEEDNALPDYNPLDLVERVNVTKFPLRIYMDHSEADIVGPNVLLMSTLLRERGIVHDYLIDPVGAHDTDYWRAHLSGYLQFYGEHWPTDVLALPSCLEPSPE